MAEQVWHPAQSAPDDIQAVIIACTLKCCIPGGTMVAVAGRHQRQWVFDFDHDVEITHWMAIPAHPLTKARGN